ncbi:TPA: hypothetical protein ACQVJ5_002729 [Serratia marcescens]|uniref:hypothetical protein n=1 Tax=Serratia TaxID=613 RepID=UPI001A1BECA6|nr:hypothetical protein [Serratia nevei]HAU4401948.1 hypothetical protein [Serratia marcescens]MDK5933441.1 hypothetical protein [Serratia nevei]MEC5547242.1 hypothetical protein [Serratia nevei]MEC5626684.1 hypothetical protein [Serratia nevei]MEC5685086.1 hypothetical protein [Serratia nevei]
MDNLSKPVAYIADCGTIVSDSDPFFDDYKNLQPLFTTQPALPEEMPKYLAGQIVSLLAHNIGDKLLAQKIWNACRAAMLAAAPEEL